MYRPNCKMYNLRKTACPVGGEGDRRLMGTPCTFHSISL